MYDEEKSDISESVLEAESNNQIEDTSENQIICEESDNQIEEKIQLCRKIRLKKIK